MNVFVARQPILGRDRRPYGYELLFRDGLDKAFDHADGTVATSQVMSNAALVFGFETLTGGAKAFINVNREVLLAGHIHLLRSDSVVPEILEEVHAEPGVLEACLKLREKGFEIALDDVTDSRSGLLDLASIIKVDFLATDETQQRVLAAELRGKNLKLLAEKIETYDVFSRAMEMGYDYFQGFFFARPQTLSRREVSASRRHHLDLIREINRPDLRFDDLHELIKRDVALSYRLLMYLNSAHFGLRTKVRSIRHAMTLLGEKEIKRWATLISMAILGEEKPSELLLLALTRARFLETMAPAIGMADEAQDLFLMGLLSLLDAIVDRPLTECLKDIPAAEDILAALIGKACPYRDALGLASCYERADWENLGRTAKRLGTLASGIPRIHLEATQWARQALGATAAIGPAPAESPA